MILGDVHYLESYDGRQLFLNGTWALQARGNYGSPPISWQTQQHFDSQGETVSGFQIGTRLVALSIIRKPAATRAEYWQNRADLMEILRPNRGGNGLIKLVIVRTDGSQRALDVRVDPGAPFEPSDNPHFDLSAELALRAHNPFWYDPTLRSITASQVAENYLRFPLRFPIRFSTEGDNFTTGDLAYAGSWKSYPTITIRGPYSQATIRNTANDAQFILINPLVAGEKRIITLAPESRDIVDENGLPQWQDLSEMSNLIDFALLPTSEFTADNTQKINAGLVASSGETRVTIEFYTRYYGI